MAQKKSEQDNVGESFEDDDIKETKVDKENTSKLYFCNICGNSGLNKGCIFGHFSNNPNNCTICNIQFKDLN